ncbi:hypothetical protein FOXYSP1_09939 [Fusarium oxysporum f. sp. phaseoli]
MVSVSVNLSNSRSGMRLAVPPLHLKTTPYRSCALRQRVEGTRQIAIPKSLQLKSMPFRISIPREM